MSETNGATINRLPTVKRSASKGAARSPQKTRWGKLDRRYIGIAVALAGLAAAILCVSLPHLQQGMKDTVGCGGFSAWCLALVFDLAQVICEALLVCLPALGLADRERKTAKCIIGACTLTSIAFNARAFLAHSAGLFGLVSAYALAVMLPIGVLLLSYLCSRVLLGAGKAKKA